MHRVPVVNFEEENSFDVENIDPNLINGKYEAKDVINDENNKEFD